MQKPETRRTALERLAALLREGRVRSLAGLAAEVGTGPDMVAAMLGDLVRRGYLREVPAASCAGRCHGCALGGICAAAEGKRVWLWSNMPELKLSS